MARRRLKKRAKTGKAKVALAEDEHFAGHEKKPAAGDRHHGIPNKTDGGKRQVEFGEALPAAEAIDDRGFVEFAWNGFQRRIKTERDVPNLTRKNEQDGAEFGAELAVRKNRDHGEHHSRQEAEHGDRLKNIQQRNHDHFGAAGAGGDVAVSERKNQAECIRDADSNERVQSVERQDAWILRNLRVWTDRAEPGTADGIDTKNRRENKKKNRDVDKKGPAPARARGPLHRGREQRRLSIRKSEIRHGASGLGERQLTGGGVVIENFGVPAPLDGGFELAAGFNLAKMLVEQIMKKFLVQGAVGFGFQCLLHLPQQGHVRKCGLSKDRFARLNVPLRKRLALRCNHHIAFFEAQKAQQGGSVDGGQQRVNLKTQFIRETMEIHASALVGENLQQTRQAAGPGVRQHDDFRPHGGSRAVGSRRSNIVLVIGPREDAIDGINKLDEPRGFAVARMRKFHAEVRMDVRGIAAENDNAVGEDDGFFDAQGALAAFDRRHAASFKRSFDVFKNGEPGEERETLKDDGNVGRFVAYRVAVPVNGAGAGGRETGQHSKQCGFAAAGGAEQGDDLTRVHGEISRSYNLDAAAVGLRVGFLQLARFDDGSGCDVCGGHERVYYRSTAAWPHRTGWEMTVRFKRSYNGMNTS